jgi:hypothetical protein
MMQKNHGIDILGELKKWEEESEQTNQEELNDVTVLEVEKHKPWADTKEDSINTERKQLGLQE